ncbi:hypothetical protein [Brevibacterium sp. CFH 10365]|uniref:hypothetical protein n=1 Tax=Brevibacterium sp. CFH 10365 TaxID=2585207 RepID=UPI001879AB93|nr:hypothetical protein [Brevibacterium sp. CFH 10365]
MTGWAASATETPTATVGHVNAEASTASAGETSTAAVGHVNVNDRAASAKV